jgi:hypothetical protein
MRRRKRPVPGIVMTAAIAALVVGALGLLCGTCGAIDTALMASPPAGNAEMKNYLQREAPAWIPICGVRALFLLILSVVAIAAGAGLLYRQAWARWLAVTYGVVSIPLHLIHGVYGAAVYMPAMERYMTVQMKGGPGFSTGFRGGFLIAFLPPLILWLSVSIFLIIAMLSPPAARAFADGEPRRRRRDEYDDDDYDDEEDDYDRPRRRRRRDDDYE